MRRGAITELDDHIEKHNGHWFIIEHGHAELSGKRCPHLVLMGSVILTLNSHSFHNGVQ